MMEAVDKVDSANLTIDEILHPTGWILVGFNLLLDVLQLEFVPDWDAGAISASQIIS